MPNRNRLRNGLLVVVLSVMAIAPGVARAEDTAAAREHYQKGTAYYDLGRFQDAVKEFEAAYEAKNDPALLYNLAQSHRLAGNTEQALHFYRTYLRRVPKAPNRTEIEGRIMALEKLLDDKKGVQSPPNQTIPPAGGIADPHPVTPPPSTTTPPATTKPVAPTTPSPPPGASAPGLFPPATTPPPPMMPPPAASSDSGGTRRILGLVSCGVGVVGIVAGALFGLGAKSAAQEITDAGAQGRAYTPHLHDVDARGRRYQTLEFVSLGIGAAALAGGAYLYFSGASATEAAPPGGRVSFLPALLPGTAAGTLQVTF